MGLCKCPKKKVTNLFCFEHRVNVCEHCLVANHPKCIVQSYLQWLQDSDYDPSCRLCGKALASGGPCVRLLCLDVFHWSCLDDYAKRLPGNTAPAGYTCPICKACIFPQANQVSPVAESLKQHLSTVNWARAGLGLPLIEEAPPPQGEQSFPPADIPSSSPSVHDGVSVQSVQSKPAPTSHSVISMDDPTLYARTAEKTGEAFQDFRKVFDTTKEEKLLNVSHDHDLDKYKRRPALQWFFRWFSSHTGTHKSDPQASMKRCAVILIVAVIGFMTLVVIFTRVGRSSADNDPFLDPLANPNIHVGQE